MNILVIGGCGFIGTHLVKSLKTKHKVRVLDIKTNRFVGESEKVEYVYGSFLDKETLIQSLENIDIVYHISSTTVPYSANLDPIFDTETNLIGTLQLLGLIVEKKIKKIIFTSSGGTVYGNPKQVPTKETDCLIPIGSYGITKVAIEQHIQSFATRFGFQYLIVRPSNPYGPLQEFDKNQGVIATFLNAAIEDKPIDLWGDGNTVRDYIYIDDLINGIILLEEEEGIYNIGSGGGKSLNEIIEVIENMVHFKFQKITKPLSKHAVGKIILDVKKLRMNTSWQPKLNLEEGVAIQLNWMKNNK